MMGGVETSVLVAHFPVRSASIFMSICARRKYGISLVTISMAALLVLLAVGFFRGQWHFVGSGTSGNGGWAVYAVDLGISEYYLIPIFLCGATGAFFLLWPSRKPPKLNQ